MKLGAYSGAAGQPTALESAEVLDRLVLKFGAEPTVLLDYRNAGTMPTAVEQANLARYPGMRLVLTWQLYKAGWGGPAWSPNEVALGALDDALRGAAERSKTLPFPIYIRFAHEMNGWWYPWGERPAGYKAAWRRARAAYRGAGGRGKWIWCPNVGLPLRRYYPGDEHVDVLGLDGYSWDGRALYDIFSIEVAALRVISDRPIWICETGCDEGPAKPNWIRAAVHGAERLKVDTLLWYDRQQERDWRIDSSPAAAEAFKAAT